MWILSFVLLCYRCDSKLCLYIGSLRIESLKPYYYLKLNFNQLRTKIKITINYQRYFIIGNPNLPSMKWNIVFTKSNYGGDYISVVAFMGTPSYLLSHFSALFPGMWTLSYLICSDLILLNAFDVINEFLM